MISLNVEGGPFHIVRRSPKQIDALHEKYGKEGLRSIDPRFFVVKAANTRSGCVLAFVPPDDDRWRDRKVSEIGGFADVCSCAEYDLTGRLIIPTCNAPAVLEIPPHDFLTSDRVRVGKIPEA